MTVMTISGVIGADATIREVNGKQYFFMPVAHNNGRESTIWVQVMIPAFGQDSSKFLQGNKIMVYGKPLFRAWEEKVQVTLWSERYEVQ